MHPKLRVILFLLLMNVAALACAALTLDRALWFWFTPIALSINVLLFTYDHVLEFTRPAGEPRRGRDEWGLLNLVHELSGTLGVRAPEVYVLERASAQAFIYSRFGGSSRLVITTGALNLLNPTERHALITHQLMMVRTSHAIINYWVGASADLVQRLGRGLERAFAFVFGWSPGLALWILRPVTWFLHFALLSPADFDRLDQATAARLPDPVDLARALWKLEAYAQTQPWADPWVFAHMCPVSPLGINPVTKAFRIQPPIRLRVQRLAGRYPL